MTDQNDREAGLYLVLNAGSSSVKFAGYSAAALTQLFHGQIDDRGRSESAVLTVHDGSEKTQQTVAKSRQTGKHSLSVAPVLEWVDQRSAGKVLAIGHRVVHGGEKFQAPVLISEGVMAAIDECTPFAPLHNPGNLQGIRECQSRYPGLPQVAVFDTAFHQSLEREHYLYPLPYEWYQQHGVRRYGFHGTSHEYVYQQAEKQLGLAPDTGAFISLHLGNGCSAAAIESGRSVDTTMGLTPLEGLMMGTRSGDIDPGLHQYLCHTLGLSLDELTNALNKRSGLLGVSQTSSDMREIQDAMEQGDQQAQLAFDMFCDRAAKSVAALRVSLSRLDAILFTGGIGEHSALTRAAILARIPWLCCPVDVVANQAHGKDTRGLITAAGDQRQCQALVVATDEEWMIARHIQALLN